MAEAAAAGVLPHVFWDFTYRELYAAFAGRNIVQRRQHQLGLFEAWHTAAFYRSKKMPVLADLLRKMEPGRVMSSRAIRAAIIGAAQAMGAVVRIVKKGSI